jgi:serine/threonine-protein kinase
LEIVVYIHDQGIVHRDIRIANVILNGERVHLIDFGLACDVYQHGTNPISDDIKEDDPTEKKLRREISFSSDFYALGHLLLFVLYSSYSEEILIDRPNSDQQIERSWEEELSILQPQTKKLLRRMLQAEQPYENVKQLILDTQAAWAVLSNK